MQSNSQTIAIIGGGAAGLFAAIEAKKSNKHNEVIVFEKAKYPLLKVKITGGGRCNLTNSFKEISDLKHVYPRGDKLMKRLFLTFSHKDTYKWFENKGVKLTTQEDNCVFPASQTSQTIIDCLINSALQIGVIIKTEHSLTNIEPQENGYFNLIFADKENKIVNKVAITTGGSAKKEGLNYMEKLGYIISSPTPSLFTLNIDNKKLCSLMGIVVEEAILSIPSTKFRSSGALLITHWGISGPATLKLSAYSSRFLNECNYKTQIAINWVGLSQEQAITCVKNTMNEHCKKQISSIKLFGLQSRVWIHILDRAAINTEKKWGDLSKKDTNKLVETLVNDIYTCCGKGKYKEEFVTCGGVSLKNVNQNTLESKLHKGLFFAGEVLDIDAITGGFNLQAAWTTGFVVGKNIVL